MDWVEQVERRLRKRNQILFTRDNLCLQKLLEEISLQSHRVLVEWAFACVERPLKILGSHLPEEKRPREAVEVCRRWAAGEVKMPEAKKALLAAHQAAKTAAPEDAALCHAVGQACAVVHVETHAIGLPMYELTALVRGTGLEACREPVEKRVAEYLDILQQCRIWDRDGGNRQPWASFLLDNSRPNKERLLAEKRRGMENKRQ